MSVLAGKGAYLWVINRLRGNNVFNTPEGDPDCTAAEAKAAGITHAIMKET